MSATLDHAAVADLAAQVSGSVVGPQDGGYDAHAPCITASSTAGPP